MDVIHLVGAEGVRSASIRMQSAAETMQSAASTMSHAFEMQRNFMNEWLNQFQQVLEANRKGDGQ